MSTAEWTRALARAHIEYLVSGKWWHEGAPLAECEPATITRIEGDTMAYTTGPVIALAPPPVGRNRAERRARR